MTVGNAVRKYKYQFIDNSIYVDSIKFNQFVDSMFLKLPSINLNKLSENCIGINSKNLLRFKCGINCMQFEDIDLIDVRTSLNKLLSNLGRVTDNTLHYNNILITDGNHDYNHGSECSDDTVQAVRRNLLEKGIL